MKFLFSKIYPMEIQKFYFKTLKLSIIPLLLSINYVESADHTLNEINNNIQICKIDRFLTIKKRFNVLQYNIKIPIILY